MIVSKLVKIKFSKPIDNAFIENELKKVGITPLRWSIVNVCNENLTINVAYDTMNV